MPEMNNFTVMVLQTNNLMITVKDSNYAVYNQYSQNSTSEVYSVKLILTCVDIHFH